MLLVKCHTGRLWTATAATVGLGNIAGVAIAVSLGGPGALLMIYDFRNVTKVCECT